MLMYGIGKGNMAWLLILTVLTWVDVLWKSFVPPTNRQAVVP